MGRNLNPNAFHLFYGFYQIFFFIRVDLPRVSFKWASQVVLVVKHLPANAGDIRDVGSTPGQGRSLEEGTMDRGAWQAHSPQGYKESDTTEVTYRVAQHIRFRYTEK